MTTCIYCRRATSEAEAAAHVLPESIWANDLVLPVGTVCTQCNNYLGKLDAALAEHKQISVCIQALSVPGKGGRPRKRLGWLERVGSRESRKVTIMGAGMRSLEIGENSVSIELMDAPGWDSRKFSRGLYHVAFNFMALSVSEALLDARFDLVRKYIRYPRRSEIWPYWSTCVGNKPTKEVALSWLQEAPGVTVCIQIFHHVFVVDLVRSEGTQDWLLEKTRGVLEWETIDV